MQSCPLRTVATISHLCAFFSYLYLLIQLLTRLIFVQGGGYHSTSVPTRRHEALRQESVIILKPPCASNMRWMALESVTIIYYFLVFLACHTKKCNGYNAQLQFARPSKDDKAAAEVPIVSKWCFQVPALTRNHIKLVCWYRPHFVPLINCDFIQRKNVCRQLHKLFDTIMVKPSPPSRKHGVGFAGIAPGVSLKYRPRRRIFVAWIQFQCTHYVRFSSFMMSSVPYLTGDLGMGNNTMNNLYILSGTELGIILRSSVVPGDWLCILGNSFDLAFDGCLARCNGLNECLTPWWQHVEKALHLPPLRNWRTVRRLWRLRHPSMTNSKL